MDQPDAFRFFDLLGEMARDQGCTSPGDTKLMKSVKSILLQYYNMGKLTLKKDGSTLTI